MNQNVYIQNVYIAQPTATQAAQQMMMRRLGPTGRARGAASVRAI